MIKHIKSAMASALIVLLTLTLGAAPNPAAANPMHSGQSGKANDAKEYQYPYWHDTTSDAVLQDALPYSGRMLILYYRRGNEQCAQMKATIDDICRGRSDIRYYMIDVDADTDKASQVNQVPTAVMVVPAGDDGHLVLLSSISGDATYQQVFDFVHDGLKNPHAQKGRVIVAADEFDLFRKIRQDRTGRVAVMMVGHGLTSRLYDQLFYQLAGKHAGDMTCIKIYQDDPTGYSPSLRLYIVPDCDDEDPIVVRRGWPVGFRTMNSIESMIDDVWPAALKQNKVQKHKDKEPNIDNDQDPDED